MSVPPSERQAYIIGGGIGGLSAAGFLIKDAHIPGKNIHVFEQLSKVGGSTDGSGNEKDGFFAVEEEC